LEAALFPWKLLSLSRFGFTRWGFAISELFYALVLSCVNNEALDQ
jgi:hypothetical protein